MNQHHPLHVLAVSSGIDEARVVELWQEAEQYAESQTSDHDSHHYWHLLHERMTTLIEHEAVHDLPAYNSPWVMFDTHLGMAYVELIDTLRECAHYVQHFLHRNDKAASKPARDVAATSQALPH